MEHMYELKTPISYSTKTGEMQDATFISMTAPTFKQIDKITPIKQAFTAAISEISETTSTEEAPKAETDDGVTGEQVMQVMYRWSGNMTGVFLHAEALFKSGAVLLDGELTLTTPLMNKMSVDDFEGLLGAYIAAFTAPSLMNGQ